MDIEILCVIGMQIAVAFISGMIAYFIGYDKGMNKAREILYRNENTKDLIKKAKKQFYAN